VYYYKKLKSISAQGHPQPICKNWTWTKTLTQCRSWYYCV